MPANFRRLFYGWSYGFLHFHTKPFLNAFETLQTFTSVLPFVSVFFFFSIIRQVRSKAHRHINLHVFLSDFCSYQCWEQYLLTAVVHSRVKAI